jgi:hypothetical protein
MADYSAYFVNDDGYIVGVKSVTSCNESEAVIAARRLLKGTKFSCLEIWDLTGCVAIVDREEAGTATRH